MPAVTAVGCVPEGAAICTSSRSSCDPCSGEWRRALCEVVELPDEDAPLTGEGVSKRSDECPLPGVKDRFFSSVRPEMDISPENLSWDLAGGWGIWGGRPFFALVSSLILFRISRAWCFHVSSSGRSPPGKNTGNSASPTPGSFASAALSASMTFLC